MFMEDQKMTGVEYVRQKCQEKGISTRKLEIDLGFSNGYLNPKRRKKLPYDRAVLIAEYLGINLNRILNLPEETSYQLDPEASKIAREVSDSKELKIIFNNLHKVDKEDIEFVVKLSERLAKNAADKNGSSL